MNRLIFLKDNIDRLSKGDGKFTNLLELLELEKEFNSLLKKYNENPQMDD